ncbi:unnamed protein product [Boreogadus saida]
METLLSLRREAVVGEGRERDPGRGAHGASAPIPGPRSPRAPGISVPRSSQSPESLGRVPPESLGRVPPESQGRVPPEVPRPWSLSAPPPTARYYYPSSVLSRKVT